MKRQNFITILISLVPLLIACAICSYRYYEEVRPKGCTPPSNFIESALIGTWKYEVEGVSDTLIFRDDGNYKQIINIGMPKVYYESEWQPWNVEYNTSNVPFIHLDGMRLCVYWEGIDCQQIGGGDIQWFNYCDEEWVKIPNEGILIALHSNHSSRGIELVALQKRSEGVTVYSFVDP
ncbi:MAG: hypothetical protein GYA36_19915 [Veillonellaceae bacterium]|nr:hypothetical protein [Veillonellaceae bacterium]